MGKINLKPLSDSVGAEILSINLTKLHATEFKEIRSALDAYGGLLFRNQELSPENLVGFSKMFGDLDHAPQMENGKTAVEGFPEIYIVSNILDDNDKPIGSLGAGEAVWHTDMSYLPNPPDFSMLYAIEVPAKGGDTSLCGMAAAYDALPKNLRNSIQKKAINGPANVVNQAIDMYERVYTLFDHGFHLLLIGHVSSNDFNLYVGVN